MEIGQTSQPLLSAVRLRDRTAARYIINLPLLANGAFGTESPGVLSSAPESSVLSMDLDEGESTDTES